MSNKQILNFKFIKKYLNYNRKNITNLISTGLIENIHYFIATTEDNKIFFYKIQ